MKQEDDYVTDSENTVHDVERNDSDASEPVARHFSLPNHSLQLRAVFGLSLHLGSSESRKTIEQKFIFQIGTLDPHGINERFSFTKFFFSRHHIPFNSVAPFSAYKPTHNPQFFPSLSRKANA